MGGGSKMLLAALVALALAAGVVACGGDDGDSSSTTSEAVSQAQSGEEKTGGGEAPKAEAKSDGEETKPADPSGDGGGGSFEPKQHEDSGGGSEQFRVKGGDNSVQGFGEEADASERDVAAAALHNFLDARAAGEWAAACSYLSHNVAKALEVQITGPGQGSTSCARGLEQMTNPAAKKLLIAEAKQVDVGSLRIEGEAAFVIYSGPENVPYAMPMALENGTWRVAGLAGGPLG